MTLIVRAANRIAATGNGLLDHSCRVAILVADVLEREPGLAEGIELRDVMLAAFLHDLDKTNWPEDYFTKPHYLLSHGDHSVIQAHPLIGAGLAQELGVTEIIRVLIEQHHEHRNGNGYPRKLADPHPAALLIGACDAYAACLEPRVYRPEPLPVFEALREASKVGCEVTVRILEKLGEDYRKVASFCR
ncbi:MAG: HD domain-containing protein [Peptococcaceae bacterium]|nr:HD domain-containing protein [Peptococcaceae bacterium]